MKPNPVAAACLTALLLGCPPAARTATFPKIRCAPGGRTAAPALPPDPAPRPWTPPSMVLRPLCVSTVPVRSGVRRCGPRVQPMSRIRGWVPVEPPGRAPDPPTLFLDVAADGTTRVLHVRRGDGLAGILPLLLDARSRR